MRMEGCDSQVFEEAGPGAIRVPCAGFGDRTDTQGLRAAREHLGGQGASVLGSPARGSTPARTGQLRSTGTWPRASVSSPPVNGRLITKTASQAQRV